MKTFGDLQEGDVIIIYDLSTFVKRKIAAITKDGSKTRMIHLEGHRWPFRAEKSFSIQSNPIVYFSCKDAVEEYLLQRERKENERHLWELQTIQELKEQYEKIRM